MKTKKTSVNRETWQTTRSERLNYYIGDLGRTLEGYIVTAFMTLFLLFQGINLVKISAAILIVIISARQKFFRYSCCTYTRLQFCMSVLF